MGGGASEGLEEAGFAVEVASGAEPGEEPGEDPGEEPGEEPREEPRVEPELGPSQNYPPSSWVSAVK